MSAWTTGRRSGSRLDEIVNVDYCPDMTPSSPTSRSSGAHARLLVLAALRRQPNHGYEIQRMIELSRTSHWARVLPGSIYHALKALAAEGLISGQGAAHRGGRHKEVFALTPAGALAYPDELRAAWRRSPDSLPADLYITLSFWEDLPGPEVVERCEALLVELRALADSWGTGAEAGARSTLIPPWQAALLRNGHAHLTADIALIEEIARLAAGERQDQPLQGEG